MASSRGAFQPVSPDENRIPLFGAAIDNNGKALTGDAHNFIHVVGVADEETTRCFEQLTNIASRIIKIHSIDQAHKNPIDQKEKKCRINHLHTLQSQIRGYQTLLKSMKDKGHSHYQLFEYLTSHILLDIDRYRAASIDDKISNPYSGIEKLSKPDTKFLCHKAYKNQYNLSEFTQSRTPKKLPGALEISSNHHDSKTSINGYSEMTGSLFHNEGKRIDRVDKNRQVRNPLMDITVQTLNAKKKHSDEKEDAKEKGDNAKENTPYSRLTTVCPTNEKKITTCYQPTLKIR